MENFTVDRVIHDTKEMLRRCGIAIYTIQLIRVAFNIYNTYESYNVYPNRNVTTSFSGVVFDGIEMLIGAILTIIMIMVINNNYERIDFNYKEVFIGSVKKLPRYIMGILIVGGIVVGSVIIYSFVHIFLQNTVISIIGIVMFAIAVGYILMRFSLMIYILILENGTRLITRSKEFYQQDKSLMIKYFFVSILTGILPGIILILLPDWLGIELSKSIFLITRVLINLIGFILAPIIYIVGLLIYKQYIGTDND